MPKTAFFASKAESLRVQALHYKGDTTRFLIQKGKPLPIAVHYLRMNLKQTGLAEAITTPRGSRRSLQDQQVRLVITLCQVPCDAIFTAVNV